MTTTVYPTFTHFRLPFSTPHKLEPAMAEPAEVTIENHRRKAERLEAIIKEGVKLAIAAPHLFGDGDTDAVADARELVAIAKASAAFLECIVALRKLGYSEVRFHAAVTASFAHFAAQRRGMEGTVSRTGAYADGAQDSEEVEVMNEMLAAYIPAAGPTVLEEP